MQQFHFDVYPIQTPSTDSSMHADRPIWVMASDVSASGSELLERMLTAAGLQVPTQCRIVYLSGRADPCLSDWMEEHKPKAVFLLGLPPQQLGIRVAGKGIRSFVLSDIHYLVGPDLDTLVKESQAKKRPLAAALWTVLQEVVQAIQPVG